MTSLPSTAETPAQCLFLSKLPPEIRIQIYGYVLASGKVHVINRAGHNNSRLGHVQCRDYDIRDPGDHMSCVAHNYDLEGRDLVIPRRYASSDRLDGLGILSTCKSMSAISPLIPRENADRNPVMSKL